MNKLSIVGNNYYWRMVHDSFLPKHKMLLMNHLDLIQNIFNVFFTLLDSDLNPQSNANLKYFSAKTAKDQLWFLEFRFNIFF